MLLSVVLIVGLLAKGGHSQLSVCGVAQLNTKIVGGQNASPGSWPWQVSLQNNGFHFCGGSLINSGWVLTAAHCFGSYTASQVTVVLGLQALTTSTSNSVSRSVSKVIVNPTYNSKTQDNDITLLQLSSPVTFTPYITPVCLAAPGSSFFNGTLTWVTGWGNIASGVSLPSPGTLQEVQIPVIGNRQCNCLYGVGSITSNMLCAGLLAGGKDSCQGDSGGPLVIKQGGVWIQAGIVSFGVGCAQPNYPGVYSRVSQYQNWINQQITSNQPGFVLYTSTGTNADLSVSCPGLPAVTAAPTTIPTTTAAPVVCGNAKLNTISGGGNSLASAGTWPWMASLQLNGTQVCGGTLIAEQFVLSSADCFSSSTNPSYWTVILGRLNQNGSNPNEVSVNVTTISLSSGATNNVAVLQLSSMPKLSNYIQPICVDQGDNNFIGNTQCWATGWGSGGGASGTLQQLSTTVVACGNASSSISSICTAALPLEQTNVGGPLMCKVGQSWIQAAVLTLSNSSSTNTSTNNSTKAATTSTNVNIFTKTSTFASFLKSVAGTLPPRATSSTTSVTNKSSSFFSVATLLLLSLSAVVHVYS